MRAGWWALALLILPSLVPATVSVPLLGREMAEAEDPQVHLDLTQDGSYFRIGTPVTLHGRLFAFESVVAVTVRVASDPGLLVPQEVVLGPDEFSAGYIAPFSIRVTPLAPGDHVLLVEATGIGSSPFSQVARYEFRIDELFGATGVFHLVPVQVPFFNRAIELVPDTEVAIPFTGPTAPGAGPTTAASDEGSGGSGADIDAQRNHAILLLHGADVAGFGQRGHDVSAYFGGLEARLSEWGWPNDDIWKIGFYQCDTKWNLDITQHGKDKAAPHHLHNSGHHYGDGEVTTYADGHEAVACRNGADGSMLHNADATIGHLGYHLAWAIHDAFTAPNEGNARCVSIIAHSMGGLIARYAIQQVERGHADFPDRLCVRAVTTIGAPHGGSDSSWICGGAQQCDDMRSGSAFISWLRTHAQHPDGTDLAGASHYTDWTIMATYANDAWTHDGVIAVSSALDMEGADRGVFFNGQKISHGFHFSHNSDQVWKQAQVRPRDNPWFQIENGPSIGRWFDGASAWGTDWGCEYGTPSYGRGFRIEEATQVGIEPDRRAGHPNTCIMRHGFASDVTRIVANTQGPQSAPTTFKLYAITTGESPFCEWEGHGDSPDCVVTEPVIGWPGGGDPHVFAQVDADGSRMMTMRRYYEKDCGIRGDAGDTHGAARGVAQDADCAAGLPPGSHDTEDWYRVNVAAQQTLHARVDADAGDELSVCLYSPSGARTACNTRTTSVATLTAHTVSTGGSWRIQVADGTGQGAYYRLRVTVGGDPDWPPSAPGDVAASLPSEYADVRLTWNAPTQTYGVPVTGYTIYEVGSDGTRSQVATTSGSEREKTFSAAPAATHEYVVTATSEHGEGSEGGPVSIYVSRYPDAPQGFQASAQQGYVRLSWSSPAFDGGEPLDKYIVCRQPAGGTWGSPTCWDVGSTSHDDTGVTNGQTYDYRVHAHNVRGWSKAYGTANGLTPGVHDDCGAGGDTGPTRSNSFGLPEGVGCTAQFVAGDEADWYYWTIGPDEGWHFTVDPPAGLDVRLCIAINDQADSQCIDNGGPGASEGADLWPQDNHNTSWMTVYFRVESKGGVDAYDLSGYADRNVLP